ncbi:PQQ-binding-like beta-propeller repeat protein [Haladaptatus pallidirubidus]|uniref:PQQ-binding-like beta-propeller repeat protein n=1 Tax=Haladaptatus pallidirubidus TaxID=1008152 RepID=UPI001D10A35C
MTCNWCTFSLLWQVVAYQINLCIPSTLGLSNAKFEDKYATLILERVSVDADGHGTLNWKFDLKADSSIATSPVVVNGLVYLGGTAQTSLYALNANDGTLV